MFDNEAPLNTTQRRLNKSEQHNKDIHVNNIATESMTEIDENHERLAVK